MKHKFAAVHVNTEGDYNGVGHTSRRYLEVTGDTKLSDFAELLSKNADSSWGDRGCIVINLVHELEKPTQFAQEN